MGLEIDMVNAGNADAIALHVVDGAQHFVAIIDGGYETDGEQLVNIVRYRYGINYVDAIISTHPDADHISGLFTVVEEFGFDGIGCVYVHDPWSHISTLALNNFIYSQHFTKRTKALAKSFEDATSFIRLVDRLGIPRIEPFSNEQIGPLTVLGPSESFYAEKLATFRDLEDTVLAELVENYSEVAEESLELQLLEKGVVATLDEKNDTSGENDSSVIAGFVWEGQRYVFTGDVGVDGLNDARERWEFGNVYWLDVPHHGSKRNLSSDLVSYLAPQVSFISAEGSRKHPSRVVVNALKKHGSVYSTHKCGNLWHHRGSDIPNRPDYVTAEPL